MPAVIEIPRDHNPFPMTRCLPRRQRHSAIRRFAGHVVGHARRAGEPSPGQRGPGRTRRRADRLTYRQLWDRASRVAGGLRAAGVRPGDRVAVRYPAGIDWVLAFWGTVMAGGVAVAVNTRSAQPEIEFVLSDSGARVDLAPAHRCPTPAVRDGATRPRGHRRAVLHLGHHRPPQGRADHA